VLNLLAEGIGLFTLHVNCPHDNLARGIQYRNNDLGTRTAERSQITRIRLNVSNFDDALLRNG